MTCSSCEAKVKSALLMVPDVTAVDISLQKSQATVSMDGHVTLKELQKAIGSKYTILAENHNEAAEKAKGWFAVYKPVLILFVLIGVVSALVSSGNGFLNGMDWMQYFMAGFFLSFSYFKLINLKGFAESYAMYDLIARRFPVWGYIYPFAELLFGIGFILYGHSTVLNIAMVAVMSVSLAGVIKTVMEKKAVQCACLGAVFNLPVSTVTIIEDSLMIVMGVAMLWLM